MHQYNPLSRKILTKKKEYAPHYIGEEFNGRELRYFLRLLYIF